MAEELTVELSGDRVRGASTAAEPLMMLVEVDSLIDEIEARRKEAIEKLDQMEEDLGALRAGGEALAEELKALQVDVKSSEASLTDLTEKKKQLDQRLERVSDLRSLEALKAEAEKLQSSIDAREEDLLALYEKSEAMDARLGEVRTMADRLADRLKETRGEVTVQINAMAEKSRRLEEMRGRLLGQVDPRTAEVYQDLRQRNGGVNAYVIDSDFCGACGYQQTTADFARMKHHYGEAFPCGRCGVLLAYVGPY